MSDRKTERLINLTLALLATKRYLKKSEILTNVQGYEGTQEAKERMFERDKDDLRSLGIEIEVGDLDVFFEDEPGYRIPQKSYELNVPNLTGRELALLSIASSYWNDSILAPTAHFRISCLIILMPNPSKATRRFCSLETKIIFLILRLIKI